MNAKGSVLLQVLIIGILLLLLITTLVKMTTEHYQLSQGTAATQGVVVTSESVIDAVQSAWAKNQAACTSATWGADQICCDSHCSNITVDSCNCSSSFGANTCSVSLSGTSYQVNVDPSSCQITVASKIP